MSTTDRFCCRLREAEVPHLARADQFLHRPRNLLDGDLGIDAVLIEQINDIAPESPERGFCDLPDVLGSTVEARLATFGADVESEFCSDHHLIAARRERLPYQLLVRERAVHLRRVEERHATINGCPDEGDHLLLVTRWPVARAHAHAAEAERRDFQV